MNVAHLSHQNPEAHPQLDRARQAAQQLVGETFFGTLMKIGRSPVFQTPYGHGGRGEEVFRAELDRVLVEQAAGRFDNQLSEAIRKHVLRAAGGPEA